jgi:TonB family protein
MIAAALLLSLAVLQEPQAQTVVEYTVVERIEMTPEQGQAVSLIMALGATVGRCADRLPLETRRAFDDQFQIVENPAPGTNGPNLADVAFLQAYRRAAADSPRRMTNSECSAELTDGRLLIEGHRSDIDSLITMSDLETSRPWERIAQDAVNAGAAPRERAALARPAELRSSGARPIPPQWAAAPRVSFPAKARGAMMDGSARIECIVTTSGRARDCRLISESAEGYGFGQEALAAEASYRFRPSTVAGEPVEARGTFTIRFRDQ